MTPGGTTRHQIGRPAEPPGCPTAALRPPRSALRPPRSARRPRAPTTPAICDLSPIPTRPGVVRTLTPPARR